MWKRRRYEGKGRRSRRRRRRNRRKGDLVRVEQAGARVFVNGPGVGGKVFATNLRNGVEAQCSNNDAIVETNNTYSCALPCASSSVSHIAESNE